MDSSGLWGTFFPSIADADLKRSALAAPATPVLLLAPVESRCIHLDASLTGRRGEVLRKESEDTWTAWEVGRLPEPGCRCRCQDREGNRVDLNIESAQ